MHPSFVVAKLWSYFMPTPPTDAQIAALGTLYKDSGYTLLPVIEAILTSEAFYTGQRMVKPPVVYLAGMMRARGKYVETAAWHQFTAAAGQRLFFPPDVAGWREDLWLNADTMRGRWMTANQLLLGSTIPSAQWATYPLETAEKAVADALKFWNYRSISSESRELLVSFAAECDPTGLHHGNQARRVNALRVLVPSLPDYQTC
jgi:hypothetical protein